MTDGVSASTQQFLFDLSQAQQRAGRAQQQISSGYRVSQASDDPDAAVSIVRDKAALAQTDEAKLNLGRVKSEVDAGEQALQSAVSLMQQARTTGAQGASDLADATTRATLADQIGSIMEQMVRASNTQVEGRYIFSGDSDQTSPYSIDWTQPNPLSAYGGSLSTRQIRDAQGSLFSVSQTAQQIFDNTSASGQSVFGALTEMRAALLANDTTAISAAQSDILSSSAYLNQQLSHYGSFQNAVSAASDSADQQSTRLQTELSGLRDTDIASAALELNQAELAQQAALSARGKFPQTSLFNYLA